MPYDAERDLASFLLESSKLEAVVEEARVVAS